MIDPDVRIRTAVVEPADPAGPRGRATGGTVPAAGLAVIALAFLPLVAAHLRILTALPYYEFLPLVPLGGVVLAWGPCRRLGALRPGAKGRSAWGLGASAALLVCAGLLSSPWLGTFAALAAVAALAYDLGGRRLARALLPAWAFLLLVLPPPMGLDGPLIGGLQGLTTWLAVPLLDALGMYNAAEGFVINVEGHRLLIREACSGASSLLTVIAATLFYALRSRFSAWKSAVLLASAAVFTLLANAGRVAAVGLLEVRYGVDAAHGWRHETLGLVACAAAVVLVLSAEQLYHALGAAFWTVLGVPPAIFAAGADPVAAPAAAGPPGRPLIASNRWLAVFGVIAALEWVWVGPFVADVLAPPRSASFTPGLRALEEDDLPARWGGFTRTASAEVRAPDPTLVGDNSRVWQYRRGGLTATVSADDLFQGWHELTRCYENVGWSLRDRRVVSPGPSAAGGRGDVVEATFEGPTGRHGLLYFSCEGEHASPLDAPADVRLSLADFGSMLLSRVGSFSRQRLGANLRRTYQFQVFIDSERPLAGAQRAEARAFFEQARGLVRARVAAAEPAGLVPARP